MHSERKQKGGLIMKAEYEVVAEIINSCAGSGSPQRFFEEVELEDTDTYVKAKRGRDWDNVEKKTLSPTETEYFLDKGSIQYRYLFTKYD